jgi:hypothetical protein
MGADSRSVKGAEAAKASRVDDEQIEACGTRASMCLGADVPAVAVGVEYRDSSVCLRTV